MNPLTVLWVVILCTLPLLGACGGGPATVRIEEEDAGSTVELVVGDTLEVILQGNPTTGYQWEMVPGTRAILQQIGEPEFEPDSEATGSGGKVTLRFKAVNTGETSLQLVYHRPWETEPPLETFSFTVVVR